MDDVLYFRIKAGDVLVNQRSPLRLRFWRNVDKDGPLHPTLGKCWAWVGHKFKRGYGRIMMDRKLTKASRVSWILHNGVIPTDLGVLHHCDNPNCCNPKHLYLGTDLDNAKDRSTRERARPHGKQQLTREQVLAIVADYRPGTGNGRHGGNSKEVAEKHGVRQDTVTGVVGGRTYKHITGGRKMSNKPHHKRRNHIEVGPVYVAAAGT